MVCAANTERLSRAGTSCCAALPQIENDHVGYMLDQFLRRQKIQRASDDLVHRVSRVRWNADSWPPVITFIERAAALCGVWRAEAWW